MSDIIKIAIVDDHPIFRDGIDRALRRQPGLLLVGVGSTAAEAVKIVEAKQPDVLLLDIGLPGGGITAAQAITRLPHPTKIIILTGLDDDAYVTDAIDAGASGYILKGVEAPELIAAIRSVHQGEYYVTPSLSTRLLLKAKRAETRDRAAVVETLNPRERRFLDLASKGMTNSDIATELDLALPTVKNTMSRIFDKLEARNRAEAIAIWLGKGA